MNNLKKKITTEFKPSIWFASLMLAGSFSCAQPMNQQQNQGFNPNLPQPVRDFPSVNQNAFAIGVSAGEWQAISGRYQGRIVGLGGFGGSYVEQGVTINVGALNNTQNQPRPSQNNGFQNQPVQQQQQPVSQGRLSLESNGSLGAIRLQAYLIPAQRMMGGSGIVNYEFHTSRIPSTQLRPWSSEDSVIKFWISLIDRGNGRYEFYNDSWGYPVVADLVGCGLSFGGSSTPCSGFSPGFSNFSDSGVLTRLR